MYKFWFQKTKFNDFYFFKCKKRVSVKNNDKISVTWSFLDPIKNCVSVKSVYVEAVYLQALLYIQKFILRTSSIYQNMQYLALSVIDFKDLILWLRCEKV